MFHDPWVNLSHSTAINNLSGSWFPHLNRLNFVMSGPFITCFWVWVLLIVGSHTVTYLLYLVSGDSCLIADLHPIIPHHLDSIQIYLVTKINISDLYFLVSKGMWFLKEYFMTFLSLLVQATNPKSINQY